MTAVFRTHRVARMDELPELTGHVSSLAIQTPQLTMCVCHVLAGPRAAELGYLLPGTAISRRRDQGMRCLHVADCAWFQQAA
jgi:hypothetical protein